MLSLSTSLLIHCINCSFRPFESSESLCSGFERQTLGYRTIYGLGSRLFRETLAPQSHSAAPPSGPSALASTSLPPILLPIPGFYSIGIRPNLRELLLLEDAVPLRQTRPQSLRSSQQRPPPPE